MEREPLIYRAKTKRKSERTRERVRGREVGGRERGETERKRVKGEEGRGRWRRQRGRKQHYQTGLGKGYREGEGNCREGKERATLTKIQKFLVGVYDAV